MARSICGEDIPLRSPEPPESLAEGLNRPKKELLRASDM